MLGLRPGGEPVQRLLAIGAHSDDLEIGCGGTILALGEGNSEIAVHWVVLAGFMRLVTSRLLEAYPDRILNIHPALLPAFPGVDAQQQALDYGVKITGCTVHYVTAEVDGGPIIDQAAVRIEQTDTLETLATKIHAAEHALLPAVIARLSLAKAAGSAC